MCSIICSSDIEKVKELAVLNEYRGQHSHSLFVVDRLGGDIVYRHRGLGPLNIDDHNLNYSKDEVYYIVHQQAPTTENKDSDTIHPAQLHDHELLWHNGIIKAKEVERLRKELQCPVTWDTHLLLRYINDYGTPDGIDGTFSCVWYHQGELFMFRNEISPLFIDDKLNISSTKFDNSTSVPANEIIRIWVGPDEEGNLMKLNKDRLEVEATFTTKENPYYFGV